MKHINSLIQTNTQEHTQAYSTRLSANDSDKVLYYFLFYFPTLEWGVRGEDVVKKASETFVFAAVYNFRADFNSAASAAMLLRRAPKYATACRALTSSVCGEHRTYKAIRIGKTQTHICICSFEFRHFSVAH